ncbi:MAG: family 43 glycosylhydrolase [Lachnospiraceae bacterium]|nr:family 43 glycosylhydrolase [Lachnospiraceae bacterium]
MKHLGFNPYLPFWETVPDGEPHVFDGRVYIFGSHDRLGGTVFCEGDYVGWSAPVDDLGNWRYEGEIYRKEQDPINGAPYVPDHRMKEASASEAGTETAPGYGIPEYDHAFSGDDMHLLYAPDVAKGPDGRYYLYYALDFVNVISVAVCDTPAGKYEFLDYVRKADGTIPQIGRWFDPAILSEKSGNYLYYGFCPPVRFPGMEHLEIPGSMMVRLADDMHTIISEPKCVANGCDTAKGTGYEAHPFFEASSIRRFGDWYYFVYSSLQGHELCYGMAKTPEGPFEYKGVIVSNGDLGLNGNELAVNYTGNNHGGLVQIKDKTYIFWHRQTHGTGFSRQGCADEVQILGDGTIPQIAITSCGLNGGPLPAKGHYETYIACHLTEADRTKVGHVAEPGPEGGAIVIPEEWPYVSEEPIAAESAAAEESAAKENTAAVGNAAAENKGMKPFVYNLRQGAIAGFKYFSFDGTENKMTLELRGSGSIEARLDTPEGTAVASAGTDTSKDTPYLEKPSSGGWKTVSAPLTATEGTHALYFVVTEGRLDFASFEIL